MKPEGSLPNSQEPSTGFYPQPDQSSKHRPILSTILSNILNTYVMTFLAVSFLQALSSIDSVFIRGRLPLRSTGQSSWLQIQRSGFDYRRYHIFREVVGLERGPLSLESTSEELLGRKSSGSGLENRDYGRRDPSR
jgi:hypothetical protein